VYTRAFICCHPGREVCTPLEFQRHCFWAVCANCCVIDLFVLRIRTNMTITATITSKQGLRRKANIRYPVGMLPVADGHRACRETLSCIRWLPLELSMQHVQLVVIKSPVYLWLIHSWRYSRHDFADSLLSMSSISSSGRLNLISPIGGLNFFSSSGRLNLFPLIKIRLTSWSGEGSNLSSTFQSPT
jgi:hypothetical protein